ncbi:replication protein A 70 kDa DNA-binding subunit C-like [Lotus japonicus]|uniref:replication protein A 70 kDa DNA-binding subunit C-like n=1 Tax=Lotus japonicus TaxID=34305 RepID=UPI002583E85E|nr:replication protein A 70 kDa DNA-binding subunit C-like [Lotus japonicus]
MASSVAIDPVVTLCPPNHNWRIKVRVVRLWIADGFAGENKPASMELILLDQHGGKIQATVRKLVFRKWGEQFVEGNVYIITFFHLIPNLGAYRPTDHAFRILFNPKTKIIPAESSIIPRWGFSLKDSSQLNDDGFQTEYLVATSEERTYVKDDIVTKMMLLEISDDKGKLECALFGEYVQIVLDYLSSNPLEKPVVVLQLAKLKSFRGKNVLQNVMKASRIIFNPEVAEAESLMDRISGLNMQPNQPVGHIISPNPSVPIFEDFMNNYPKKTICALNETTEDGLFIVYGTVVGLLQDDPWWYFACKCHKAVTFDDGLYFCPGCCKHVMDVSARYKIKLEVFDDTDSGNFMLFDSDAHHLIKKSCKDMLGNLKDPKSAEITPLMEEQLVGKELLFKVEKKSNNFFQFDDSYCVKRICDDPSIIEAFKALSAAQTSNLARCPTPLTVVNSAGDKVAVEDPSESCVVLSPEVLTPSLGSDPSYVESSANIFKRKADEDCKKPPTVPKLKMKNVKVEKK